MTKAWWAGWERGLGDAAEKGRLEEVRAILAAHPVRRQRVMATALARSAHHQHLDVMRALLAAGASPNVLETGSTGRTPMMAAAQGQKLEAVRLLADAGADPNLRSRFGLSPLHQATVDGHEPTIRALHDVGASTHMLDKREAKPRDLALSTASHHRFPDRTAPRPRAQLDAEAARYDALAELLLELTSTSATLAQRQLKKLRGDHFRPAMVLKAKKGANPDAVGASSEAMRRSSAAPRGRRARCASGR